MQGERKPDQLFYNEPEDKKPGDFWKFVKEDGTPFLATEWVERYREGSNASKNLTNTVWGYVAPNGLSGYMVFHTVREHEDGMISVLPDDGSSNSIKIYSKRDESDVWHGYIYKGEWRKA